MERRIMPGPRPSALGGLRGPGSHDPGPIIKRWGRQEQSLETSRPRYAARALSCIERAFAQSQLAIVVEREAECVGTPRRENQA